MRNDGDLRRDGMTMAKAAPPTQRRLRGLAPAAFLLLAACTNGTGAVPGLQTGSDRLLAEKSPGALLRVADATRESGDKATAVRLYQRAHELAPQDPVPLVHLGATLAEMQVYTE